MRNLYIAFIRENAAYFSSDVAAQLSVGFLLGGIALSLYKNIDPHPAPGQAIFFVLFMSSIVTLATARWGFFLSIPLNILNSQLPKRLEKDVQPLLDRRVNSNHS